MDKMKLTVDALEVESFETADARDGRGTVMANVGTDPNLNCTDDPAQATCGIECVGPYSQRCTGNVNDFHCHDSIHFCDDTIQATSCPDLC